MENDLNHIKQQFDLDLAEQTLDFDEIYLRYFSKTKGLVTQLVKALPKLSPEEKVEYGPKINRLRVELKQKLEDARNTFAQAQKEDPLIDLTAPAKAKGTGYMHPTNQVIQEMNQFFRYYGYSVAEGPEIETSEYNFRKLNLPEGHPATDLQDTLFIDQSARDSAKHVLLRTHTSSVEARLLTENEPPIRVVVPGKCFRNETPNATNIPFFHQYQGVVVDKKITIQNLKATLEQFHKFLFGEDTKLRFRYKYYPEVSPGMGVDMMCKFCSGKGCTVCKHRGWIEVLGSGMIHYNTLKMCGIDPEIYSGFAFGMGLDRLVMQKFGVNDIRHLYGGGMIYE